MPEEPRVLVACPTCQSYDAPFQRWIANVFAFTYPRFDIFVSDNSADHTYYRKYASKIHIGHVKLPDDYPPHWRICESMEQIRQHMLAGPFDYWMNIEVDVIPPPDVIQTMIGVAHSLEGTGAHWVSHGYPANFGSPTIVQGIGCSLLSWWLVKEFDWRKAKDSPDVALWEWVQKQGTYRTVELWNVMNVEHLKI